MAVWKRAEDALARVPLFRQEGGEVLIERCTLKAGALWQMDTYAMNDRAQIFFFLNESGYVVTDSKAWNIGANSMFVPNFDRENAAVKAVGRDLEMLRFACNMTEYDARLYVWYHMILPRYIGYDKAFSYVESFTGLAGSAVRTANLIVETAFGRWSFGMDYGVGGKEFASEHVLPEFDQWVCALPGADFVYVVDGKRIPMKENDTLFIRMGSRQEILPADEGKVRYLWVKCATNGWSDGRDGDIGSEP